MYLITFQHYFDGRLHDFSEEVFLFDLCVFVFVPPGSDIFTHRVIETEREREECLFMEGRCLSVIHLTDNPTGNHIYFYLLSLSAVFPQTVFVAPQFQQQQQQQQGNVLTHVAQVLC